jgi:tRNA pseudouridine32 synthase/23S rRNA pseudouridine746 synthase
LKVQDNNSTRVIHPLESNLPLPSRMNNPFYYEPHPLCRVAARQLLALLEQAPADFLREIEGGKMFGVLIVKPSSATPSELSAPSSLSWLAAYSGQIGGRSDWPGFVPAVFDYLQPCGYFKTHEAEITALNRQIDRLEQSDRRREATDALARAQQQADRQIADCRLRMQQARQLRHDRRAAATLTAAEQQAMIRESQFQKAELHRLKQSLAEQLAALQADRQTLEDELTQLRERRHALSDALQRWLFSRFRMLNGHGERRTLLDIFAPTPQHIPPAGAGECCAPKLLQYAFEHRLQPVCMMEFWYGASPRTEIRHHLHPYPACQGKCKPILAYMLQGISVEPNPLEAPADDACHLETLYDDEALTVVCKPAGMLSVPGKSRRESVYDILRQRYPMADGPLIVHRLDMATSGLLVVAKTRQAHRLLQKQFRERTVRKRYVALLSQPVHADAPALPDEGTIRLPLRPDPMDRPRQIVDPEHGKPAITSYKVLTRTASGLRVALYPHTGRTHQLRVHCAHALGLDRPILGDTLYGRADRRLFLHAEALTFRHPLTGEELHFERKADF